MRCHIYDYLTKDFDLYLTSRLSLTFLAISLRSQAVTLEKLGQELEVASGKQLARNLGTPTSTGAWNASFPSQALR